PDTFNSPIFYINTLATATTRSVPWNYTDGIAAALTGSVTFNLGGNQAPTGTATTLPGGTVLSGSVAGTVKLSITAYADAESNAVTADVDWDNSGTFVGATEIGLAVSGATPVNLSSPLKYDNPTAANQTRNLPYRINDALHTGSTVTTSFTLGANRAPIVNSGTIGLASASQTSPATFSITPSALSITDPEGDVISYTVTGTPNTGAPVTNSGAALPLSNGTYVTPVASVTFVGYANDTLHAGVTGTSIPTSPSPLTGTVTACGLTMAAVNTTLATLTTGSVLRAGTAANQTITGIRVGWTDIAGEAEYVIQRGTWADGATVASVVFSNLGTAVANATSYDDTTINPSGTRYLYRVAPRCGIGSSEGTVSQLAMVAIQDFESTTGNNDAYPQFPANGWDLNTISTASTTVTTTNAGNALNGTRSLRFNDFGTAANIWMTFNPPLLNDRASLGTLSTSTLEFNHSWANGGSVTSGYAGLTNTAAPTDGDATAPIDPNNWRWLGTVSSGTGYNDNASTALTGLYTNIAGQVSGNYNWGNSGGAIAETFSRLDATIGTITNSHNYASIALAGTAAGTNEDARFDDVAWIVY
ncbi:MAG: hypothetical protein ABI743_08390, partial [bacterium]